MKATLNIEGDGYYYNICEIATEEEFLQIKEQISDGTWKNYESKFKTPSEKSIISYGTIDTTADMGLYDEGNADDDDYYDDDDDVKTKKVDEEDPEIWEIGDIPFKNVEIIPIHYDLVAPKHYWIYREKIHGTFFHTEVRLRKFSNFDPDKLEIVLHQYFLGEELIFSDIVEAYFNKKEMLDLDKDYLFLGEPELRIVWS